MKYGEIKMAYGYDSIMGGKRNVFYDIYITNTNGIPINYIREKRIDTYEEDGTTLIDTVEQGPFANVIVNQVISETDVSVLQDIYGRNSVVITWTQPLTEMTQG